MFVTVTPKLNPVGGLITSRLENVLRERLKMNCPSDCPHDECTFYGHDGLIGHFDGYARTGEECRYDEIDSDTFVLLSPRADGITEKPPVERVAIEASYENIPAWAVDKFGQSQSSIIEYISRERLGISSKPSSQSVNTREARHEQNQLEELPSDVKRDFDLPTGQKASFRDEPIQLIT